MRNEQPAAEAIRKYLTQILGNEPQELSIERKSLRGGLESSSVNLVTTRFRDGSDRTRMLRFVCKELRDRGVREAAIYSRLAAKHAGHLSPRLIAVEYTGPDRALLWVEAVRRTRAWPWRDMLVADELLGRLARFHRSATGLTVDLPEWDYGLELRSMAEATWGALDGCRMNPELSVLASDLPALKRLVLQLSNLRRQLLSERPFASCAIHGDVHPGNAVVRRRSGGDEPVLLDWGRARLGSPLEDVSSWLQSLGYFEETARRHHDRLLTGYLSALGLERRLTSTIRAAYWMAGASNALSGALLHHLCLALDERQSAGSRAKAAAAARDWLRVIRRADAWCS
jgi:hypothetical protein